MKIKEYFIVFFTFILCATICLSYVQAQSDCPPCSSDQIPMSAGGCNTCQGGCGACSECGSRRVIKVRIHSSWDTTPGNTDPNIWNGVVAATQMWNSALDSFGNGTAYCFQVDQSTSNPHITIRKGTPSGGGCADTNIASNGGPYTTQLPEGTQSYSHDTISSRVAHEFGHTIGLDDIPSSTCSSIMNGVNPLNETGS